MKDEDMNMQGEDDGASGARDDLLARLEVPGLEAGEVDRIVAAAMPAGGAVVAAATGGGWAAGWGRWVSHAAALALGAVLASAWPSEPVEPLELARAEVEIREVRVEVPVEVPVQVRVEVPVEVERVTERIVYRDRPVEERSQRDESVGLVPTRSARARLSSTHAPRPHVEVRRDGGRVRLMTRGSLPEVVPVLIDTMENGDTAVAAAAFDRLQSIRVELGDEALDLRPGDDAGPRRGGLQGRWSVRGTSMEPADPQDPSVWRDWWSRQELASGVTRVATSI